MILEDFYEKYKKRAEKAFSDFRKALDDLEDKRFNLNLNLIKETINEINESKKIITQAIYTDQEFEDVYGYVFNLEILAPNSSKQECDRIKAYIHEKVDGKLITNYKCEDPFFIFVSSNNKDLCYDGYSKLLNF